jgi:hypothetical protein
MLTASINPEEITMYKDTTYKEKFTILKNWLPLILNDVKKDLKKDHWQQDPQFVKVYLGNKPQQKITQEEMVEGYTLALAKEEKAEDIAEFISTRWLFKHSDIYHFFENELRKLATDFTTLDEIDAATADPIASKSAELFGAANTYLFCVMNSVVFPEKTYNSLRSTAEKEQREQQTSAEVELKLKNEEEVKRHYETQISRITDRFEKKLAGMERKYHVDTETLKKQIRNLQKKLDGVSV